MDNKKSQNHLCLITAIINIVSDINFYNGKKICLPIFKKIIITNNNIENNLDVTTFTEISESDFLIEKSILVTPNSFNIYCIKNILY